MTFIIWNITMLNNGLFMSYQRFKKGTFLKKWVFIKLFLHTFWQKWTFCYTTTFFELLITHKQFIFEHSCVSYGKRQKSCTLIVIWVKCLYLTSPIFNSSAKSNRLFFIAKEEVYLKRNKLTMSWKLRAKKDYLYRNHFEKEFKKKGPEFQQCTTKSRVIVVERAIV